MVDKSSEQKPTLGKRGIIIIALCIVVILILLIAVIVLLQNNKQTTDAAEETKRNVVITHDNAEELVNDMFDQEYIEPGYYSTAMTTEWHFETGDAVSEDAYVANRAENTNDIYFDVFLAEDETEAILESPVITRGSELDNITLDKPLDAGTYDCVMVYHLVDEEQNTISTLRVGFTIIVEN